MKRKIKTIATNYNNRITWDTNGARCLLEYLKDTLAGLHYSIELLDDRTIYKVLWTDGEEHVIYNP